ncbi:glycoside hydrolase family 16 protein [Alicyclobacillus fastidiosus]|uniref:licheninase n=1 Tax=Alicyclobacillus fastidiosus TaxID=392011 RepID=A0ABV5AEQ4_9BACL|nr:glycoside hydrolase family 16 protein [Alicyclobacillus fastidiosus]WEH09534.1 glycoside hydrolase family 16 protein [Alicyclobacillus fastidiosus]
MRGFSTKIWLSATCFVVLLGSAAFAYKKFVQRDTSTTVLSQTPPKITSPLTFSDDFDESLRTHTWHTFNQAWPYGGQLQSYSAKNVYVKNGNLVIETDKASLDGKDYVSGRLDTKDSFQFTYGTVEIRAKMPSGQGLFPALWLKPVNHPVYPEIDLLEFVGSKPHDAYVAFHGAAHGAEENVGTMMRMPYDLSQGFHTYELVWKPNSLSWYIDGTEIYQITKHVPDEPMYLTINTAVGGPMAGSPSSQTKFPTFMNVDYVHVYSSH